MNNYLYGVRMKGIGNKIKQLLLDGKNYNEICRELQVAKSTVAYHARKLELKRGNSFERKEHDWSAIQKYYDEGYCMAEVAEHFNMRYSTLIDARKTGKFKANRKQLCKKYIGNGGERVSNDVIFVENSQYDAIIVRKRIKKYNFLDYRCSNVNCLLHHDVTWNGIKIVLQVDHINGIRNDHRLCNLRYLCPNCHSQTDTFCGRNKK